MVPRAGRPRGESAEEGRECARRSGPVRASAARGDQGGPRCSGRLPHAPCTELPCPGPSSFLDSSRPCWEQTAWHPSACGLRATCLRASFQGHAGAATRPPRRVSELGPAIQSLGRFCSLTPGGW